MGLCASRVKAGDTDTPHRGIFLFHMTPVVQTTGWGNWAKLSTERHTIARKTQRYVYVELKSGVDPVNIKRAVRSDPHFLGERDRAEKGVI